MEQGKTETEDGSMIRSLEDVIGVVIREGWTRGTIPKGTLLFHATMHAFSETHIKKVSFFSTNLIHPSARFFESMMEYTRGYLRSNASLNPRVIVYRTTRDITVYGSDYHAFHTVDMKGLPQDAEGVWKTSGWEEVVSISDSFVGSLKVEHIMHASITSLKWLGKLLESRAEMTSEVMAWTPSIEPPMPRDVKGARATLETSVDVDLQYRTTKAFSSQGNSEGVALSLFSATFNSNISMRYNQYKLVYNYRWVDPEDGSVKALACMWYFPPNKFEGDITMIMGVEYLKGYQECRKEFMRAMVSWGPTASSGLTIPYWAKLYVDRGVRIIRKDIRDTHFKLKKGGLTMSKLEGHMIRDVYAK